MKKVDLSKLDYDISFKIKMEAYLYVEADKMLEAGKGDPKKLGRYMRKRIEIIEELLKIGRPFKLVEGKESLLEVSK